MAYGVKLQRSAPLRLLPHPQTPVNESWRSWALRQPGPKAIDLFSGAGGLSLGLEQAGFSVVLSVDHDPWSLETHRHNFPGAALNFNLSDPEKIDTLVRLLSGIELDLVAGGPPCQPFSRAGRSKIRSLVEEGKRPAADHRRELWRSFLQVIEAVRPRAVLMENVPDMALGDDLATVRILIDRLEKAGYDVYISLIDAWRHGIPQHRQRFFLVAVKGGHPFSWPQGQKKVSLRDAIGDLPKLGDGVGARELPYTKPLAKFQIEARAGMVGDWSSIVWDHVTRPVREDDREAFNLLFAGTRYSELPEKLRRYRADIFDDKYNRLHWEELSRSITAHLAKDGYWYIHPEEHRTLTVREAARIQTFPDHFRFAGSRSHAFTQIGNAVPPGLAKAVATSIMEALQSKPLESTVHQRVKLSELRTTLRIWAKKDAKKNPWRHRDNPWAVLSATVLQPRPNSDKALLLDFLETFPTPESLVSSGIKNFSRRYSKSTQRPLLHRLSKAAREIVKSPDSWSGSAWAKAANLNTAQEAWVGIVGVGEDTLATTAPALRVAGRITGQPLERKLSDGKIVLGRILGLDYGPEITAALSAIGTDFCSPSQPSCELCPLTKFCASSTTAEP